MFKTSLAFFIYFLCYSKCVFIPLCEFSVSSVVSPWDHSVCSTLNAGSEHCCLPTALAADGCYVTEHWTTPPSQRASPDPEPATPQCRLIHKPTAALCRAHSPLTKHICYVFLCTWKKKKINIRSLLPCSTDEPLQAAFSPFRRQSIRWPQQPTP